MVAVDEAAIAEERHLDQNFLMRYLSPILKLFEQSQMHSEFGNRVKLNPIPQYELALFWGLVQLCLGNGQEDMTFRPLPAYPFDLRLLFYNGYVAPFIVERCRPVEKFLLDLVPPCDWFARVGGLLVFIV